MEGIRDVEIVVLFSVVMCESLKKLLLKNMNLGLLQQFITIETIAIFTVSYSFGKSFKF